ncbi:unnamed protein product [Mytilus edulis]|uniref:VWFA domain-containing protein n=1 Tax=Mytilus edulis TaxID=6550 RepID=A0A8S3UN84_MYTED|nr:unnamed protein product [Mytilus edulis]
MTSCALLIAATSSTASYKIPDIPDKSKYCQTKVDIDFVVDTSRSIPHIDFTRQNRFIEDIIRFRDVGPDKTRVASVSFSNYNFPEFGFNNLSRKQDILNAINRIKHSQDGKTNPSSYDTYLDESGKQQTQIKAAIIKARPAFIFVIGVGSLVDIDELNGMSSNPDEEFTIQVSSFEALNTDTVKRTLLSRSLCGIDHSQSDATRTYLALEYTHFILYGPGNGERPDVADVVIVLTDGKTNPGSYDKYGDESGKRQTQIEAAIIKARPAFILVIGVGRLVDIDELNGMSSYPDDQFAIQVSSFEALNTDTVKRTFLSRVCVGN